MTSITPNSSGVSGVLLNQYRRNNEQVAESLERLSTGKRINRPSDDPAGFIAAENIQGDIVDLRAESKAANGNRFRVRQRESALSQIQQTLTNVRGSLVEAAGNLNSATQNRAIQQDIEASLDAIDSIASRTQGVDTSSRLHELREGGAANVIDGDIGAATELVDSQLSRINQARAAAGAYLKTEEIYQHLRDDQIAINTETRSQIEDVEYAQETSKLVQGQILSEASIRALAYVNRESVEQIQELLEELDAED